MAQEQFLYSSMDFTTFNKEVQDIGKRILLDAKFKIATLGIVNKGVLLNSLKYKVRKPDGVAQRVSFQFSRHGIFKEKGAGRSYGGSKGTTWWQPERTNLKSRKLIGGKRKTNPTSFGKMGTGARPEKPWFNPSVDENIEDLAKAVNELRVNWSKLFPELKANMNAKNVKIK